MNITDTELLEITELAISQVRLEREIENLEETLKARTEKYKQLSEVLIPEAMMAVGLESFKLADGTSIKIDKFYSGKIPDDKTDEAFAWLRETHNDSLIKREVKMMFGKGEDVKAQALVDAMVVLGYTPTDKQSVHPMTLKSFIREQVESGANFPMELFGAYVGNKTKIVPAKK